MLASLYKPSSAKADVRELDLRFEVEPKQGATDFEEGPKQLRIGATSLYKPSSAKADVREI